MPEERIPWKRIAPGVQEGKRRRLKEATERKKQTPKAAGRWMKAEKGRGNRRPSKPLRKKPKEAIKREKEKLPKSLASKGKESTSKEMCGRSH